MSMYWELKAVNFLQPQLAEVAVVEAVAAEKVRKNSKKYFRSAWLGVGPSQFVEVILNEQRYDYEKTKGVLFFQRI